MQEKCLLILGAGGYGQLARETAEAMGIFTRIAFLDDQNPQALGKLSEYRHFCGQFDCAFVAMGAPSLREHWINALKEAGYALPPLVHPAATVACGTLICAGSVVNHNAQVLAYCQIDCNAVVAAGATVPSGTKVRSATVYER